MQAKHPAVEIISLIIDSSKLPPQRAPLYLSLPDSSYSNPFSESSSEVIVPDHIAREEITEIVHLEKLLKYCEADILGLRKGPIVEYRLFLPLMVQAFGLRKKGDRGELWFTRSYRKSVAPFSHLQ